MALLVQQLPQTYQAVEVEAMAACKALKFGRETGLEKVIVEGDCSTVVKALCKADKGMASYGLLIKDAEIFFGLFSEFLCSHIMRDNNRIAHGLARLTMNL